MHQIEDWHMRLLANWGKISIGVCFGIVSLCVNAMPEVDSMTICYGVDSNDKQSFKAPCIVTNTGGGGSLVTIYQFNNKEYTIVSEDSGNWLNDEPFEGYTRGVFFERLSPSEMDYSYFCYQSKSVHFCSKQ